MYIRMTLHAMMTNSLRYIDMSDSDDNDLSIHTVIIL